MAVKVVCRLKQMMNSKGLSLNRLSNETGIGRPTLTLLYRNIGKGVQYQTIEILCEYFQCSLEDLFIAVYGEDAIKRTKIEADILSKKKEIEKLEKLL